MPLETRGATPPEHTDLCNAIKKIKDVIGLNDLCMFLYSYVTWTEKLSSNQKVKGQNEVNFPLREHLSLTLWGSLTHI